MLSSSTLACIAYIPIYCVYVTNVLCVYYYIVQAYIFVGDPTFHEIAYGVIVVAITFHAFYNLK